MSATTASPAPRLGDCCALCNVWVSGSWPRHARGARHAQFSGAARAAFRAAAPAAVALSAALVRLELRASLLNCGDSLLRGAVCRCCREPIAGGLRAAIAHLRSAHHTRRQQLHDKDKEEDEASPPIIMERRESLVRGVVCTYCVCAVTGLPERHLLSARHQRNVQCHGEQAQERLDEWEKRLKYLLGNICCCCAEYVSTKEIIEHFTSSRHARAQKTNGARAEKLQALLQRVPVNRDRRYCAVCRVAPKSSMSFHQESRAHSMALLRAFSNDEDPAVREKLLARLTLKEEKEAERENEAEIKESKKNDEGGGTDDSVDKNSRGAQQVGPLQLPPLLRFVRGECVVCREAAAADTIALIALPISEAHCCAEAKGLASSDLLIVLAGRWLEMAFRALREDPSEVWHEPIESRLLQTDVEFTQMLQCEEQSAAFSNAVCAALVEAQLL